MVPERIAPGGVQGRYRVGIRRQHQDQLRGRLAGRDADGPHAGTRESATGDGLYQMLVAMVATGTVMPLILKALFHSYAAVSEDNAMEGARLALGGAYETRFDLSKARVIACLEADPLYTWPGSLRHMRSWADKREPSAEMNRLYAIECSMSVTGMSADHRLRVAPSHLERVALALAAKLGSRGGPLSRLAAPGAKAGLAPAQQHPGRPQRWPHDDPRSGAPRAACRDAAAPCPSTRRDDRDSASP